MKTISKILFISLLIVFIIVGCTNEDILEENRMLQEKIEQLSKELKEYKKEQEILKEEVESLENRVKTSEFTQNILEAESNSFRKMMKEQMFIYSNIDNSSFLKENYVFPVYTANVDTYKKEIEFYIYVPKDLSLKEKLDVIGDKLSRYRFSNLPIELSGIEEENGKKIAVIKLEESVQNQEAEDYTELKGRTWRTHYFQGSCGGTVTMTTLIETFLQREYKGEWIDGVVFNYSAERNVEFEHVSGLFGVNYR